MVRLPITRRETQTEGTERQREAYSTRNTHTHKQTNKQTRKQTNTARRPLPLMAVACHQQWSSASCQHRARVSRFRLCGLQCSAHSPTPVPPPSPGCCCCCCGRCQCCAARVVTRNATTRLRRKETAWGAAAACLQSPRP